MYKRQVQATVTRVDPEKGIVALDLGKGGEAILPRNEQVPGEVYTCLLYTSRCV